MDVVRMHRDQELMAADIRRLVQARRAGEAEPERVLPELEKPPHVCGHGAPGMRGSRSCRSA